jgi:hypothetical protein
LDEEAEQAVDDPEHADDAEQVVLDEEFDAEQAPQAEQEPPAEPAPQDPAPHAELAAPHVLDEFVELDEEAEQAVDDPEHADDAELVELDEEFDAEQAPHAEPAPHAEQAPHADDVEEEEEEEEEFDDAPQPELEQAPPQGPLAAPHELAPQLPAPQAVEFPPPLVVVVVFVDFVGGSGCELAMTPLLPCMILWSGQPLLSIRIVALLDRAVTTTSDRKHILFVIMFGEVELRHSTWWVSAPLYRTLTSSSHGSRTMTASLAMTIIDALAVGTASSKASSNCTSTSGAVPVVPDWMNSNTFALTFGDDVKSSRIS